MFYLPSPSSFNIFPSSSLSLLFLFFHPPSSLFFIFHYLLFILFPFPCYHSLAFLLILHLYLPFILLLPSLSPPLIFLIHHLHHSLSFFHPLVFTIFIYLPFIILLFPFPHLPVHASSSFLICYSPSSSS